MRRLNHSLQLVDASLCFSVAPQVIGNETQFNAQDLVASKKCLVETQGQYVAVLTEVRRNTWYPSPFQRQHGLTARHSVACWTPFRIFANARGP